MNTPNASAQTQVPNDLFDEVLTNCVPLALAKHDDRRNRQPSYPVLGAQIVQKFLVVSAPEQKMQIVNMLKTEATSLLWHESGCFVVCQILREGSRFAKAWRSHLGLIN